jgi:transcriptional regulator with XRE-family HTH domain
VRKIEITMPEQFDLDDVLRRAYETWLWQYARDLREADEFVMPFRAPFRANNLRTRRPEHSWLRLARYASRRSLKDLAGKLEIDPSTWISLENSERRGSITIERLQNAAEALDCELIYVIRPKEGRVFSEKIWAQLEGKVRAHLEKMTQPPYEARIVRLAAALARDLSANSAFRRSAGWGRPEKRQRKSLP